MRPIIFGVILIALQVFTACTTQEKLTHFNPDAPTPDHSGMWMMPQLTDGLYSNLEQKGIRLSADDIYNPDAPSLVNTITRINIGGSGGGTGSIISADGLILTNHHVAYDGIAAAGGTEKDYLKTGFYAESMNDEIPLEGYTLHIPLLQKDVTDRFNNRLDRSISFEEKLQVREEVRQELIQQYSNGDSDLLVEVDEILSGNRMILSVYKIIRDVRLVYAPEEAIGKFGGDIDNWMWPRHTGDYTFLRAYTSKNGDSESYQPDNVPYKPETHLKIRNDDLKPGDFIMTLGFPGSTYRLESSYAFDYYEKYQFPVLEKVFSAYLNGLEIAAADRPEIAQQNASERASIANTLKYFNGVRKGFEEQKITRKKLQFDQAFKEWAAEDSLRNLRYGRVLPQLEQSYQIASQTGDVLYLTFYAIQFSKILQSASLFEELTNTSESDMPGLRDEDKLMLFDALRQTLSTAHFEAEKATLTDLLATMAELPEDKRPLVFHRFFDSENSEQLKTDIEHFVDRRFSDSVLSDTSAARKVFLSDENPQTSLQSDSLFIIASDIHDMLEQSRENYVRHFTYLQPAQERYVEGILSMQGERPYHADANFTLRLSAGNVMGYKPEDGVYKFPFTTFDGMTAKHRDREPFDLPDQLLEYHSSYSEASSLNVNFLSTNDITGGNSGSPALNEHGELVGLVFDGNIEGIASDYHFLPELTRTLSVDIRFILFMMEEIDRTERILEEIEIVTD